MSFIAIPIIVVLVMIWWLVDDWRDRQKHRRYFKLLFDVSPKDPQALEKVLEALREIELERLKAGGVRKTELLVFGCLLRDIAVRCGVLEKGEVQNDGLI